MYNMNNAPRRETDVERISRQVRERNAHIIANPSQYTKDEVDTAKLHEYQHSMLQVRDILRYG